jgi:hypothetical protein
MKLEEKPLIPLASYYEMSWIDLKGSVEARS